MGKLGKKGAQHEREGYMAEYFRQDTIKIVPKRYIGKNLISEKMLRTIAILVFGLVMGLGNPTDIKGTMKNYQCVRCGELVRGADHVPSELNCRARGQHRWVDLGAVGHEIYYCKRCETWVGVLEKPTDEYCPVKGRHQWFYLGHEGEIAYRCERCDLTIHCDRTPTAPGCSQGGAHQWNRL